MSELTPVLRQRFFDSNGDPLAGGKLYSYVANSVTPQATYTDETGVTPNANPIILDANGEANVWINSGFYKFVLADSADVVQWTVDNVQSLAAQIATQIAIAGALAVINNLSDLNNVNTALSNLGIAPYKKQVPFAITGSQAATTLAGESFDGTVYSSAVYEYEIQQAFSGYLFVIASANATIGATYTNNGITFTVVATIAAGLQLKCTGAGAPTSVGTLTKTSGTGDATISFSQVVPLSTIFAMGSFSLHFENGIWVYAEGTGRGGAHGVTFSLTQATSICQLKAAESGLGNGTLKLKKHLFTV